MNHSTLANTDDSNVAQASVECPANLDVAFVERVRHALETTFGVRFEVWYHDGHWNRITAESQDYALPLNEQNDASLAHALSDAMTQNNSQCHVTDARESLLAIPFDGPRKLPIVATANFRDVPPSFLVRYAQMFVRGFGEQQQMNALRQENDAFLRQVTNDFEELSYLRSMAELLEVSDLSFDLVAMAKQVLPTLKPLIEADALVLVIAKRKPGKNLESTRAEIDAIRIWEGPEHIHQDVCIALVEQYAGVCRSQPVVKNRFQEMAEGADFSGIDSFVLVPVAHGNDTFGWMLAVNRNNENNLNVGEVPWEVSYLEFGTHEATLMSSSAAILATHSRNVELFREREQLLISVVKALVSAIEAKDEYTRGHSERVALFGKRLAEAVGLSQERCENIYLSGLLHDIGKIGVRDAVLSKPGRLDDAEFEEIKTHSEKGWGILSDLKPLSDVLPGVLHHHENYDGRGYPDKLEGHEIPMSGRILAVADAFDAMTSDRPYRAGMPLEKAEAILRTGAGQQWDPLIVETFLQILPEIIEIRDCYSPRPQTKRRTD